MVDSSRKYWADYVKAAAIWLMVMCHFGLGPESLAMVIYSFHMPAFFLVSGYFDKGRPLSMELVRHNARLLVVPYFFFSICALSICWISPMVHPDMFYGDGSVAHSLGRAVVGMLLMDNTVRPMSYMPCGALWFLVALFEVKLAFAAMCWCWRRCKWAIVAIVAAGVVLYECHVPYFSLDSAAMALPFYAIGFALKRLDVVERVDKRWMCAALAALCWAYVAFVSPLNGRISINSAFTGRCAPLCYVNGVIGSLALIFTCRVPRRRQGVQGEATSAEVARGDASRGDVVQRIGACTLTILGTHSYVNLLRKVVLAYGFAVAVNDIPQWCNVLFSVLALFVGMWIHEFLAARLPWAVGKDVGKIVS